MTSAHEKEMLDLLTDIETDLLPASQTNWLNSKWAHDLFPRVRALRLALQAEPQEGWRAMESAPKDGTRILMWRKGFLVMLGGWAGHGSYGGPTWWSNNVPIVPVPTHWCPLPAPPTTEER